MTAFVPVVLAALLVAACGGGDEADRERVRAAVPCEDGAPIGRAEVLRALRAHGFSAQARRCEVTNVPAGGTAPASLLADEGVVSCVVRRQSPAGAPTEAALLDREGGDGRYALANVECSIFAEGDERHVRRLERALAELERAVE